MKPADLFLILSTTFAASPSLAQEARPVTAGAEYAGGGMYRFWFGDGYRDLWTKPVQAPVLDLKALGGGLTPVRQVGQAQSLGLAFKGADGRAYTFRSLHKEPDRMLPEMWRKRLPGRIARDQTSGTHPAAAVILPLLAEAAGVAHTNPRLVVMPDDPSLGEFRKTFANQFGTIDEFPLAGPNGTPGFQGATEIISSTELWRRGLAGPENRIDSRSLLRARILDLWVDNFDRHMGQWRWMKVPGQEFLQPLPEDPDMVLVHHDGILMMGLRGTIPRLLNFGENYSGKLEGPLINSFEVDRWLLADLDAAEWEKAAKDLQARFTDEVIDRALRQMPPEWYATSGDKTAAALRTRRAALVDYIMSVYRFYAKDVDIHATNRAERVTIARGADNSLDVTIALAGAPVPSYHRRFLPAETDEIRVYLHDGDDQVERSGPAGGPIRVRVIAGGGRDVVDDAKSGGTDVWTDAGSVDVNRGPGTNVRSVTWSNPAPVKDAPWIEPRSFGHWSIGKTLLSWSSDLKLLLGYGVTRTAWGFRTEPASSVQTLHGVFATGETNGKAEYIGMFRRPVSRFGLQVQAFGSGIEHVNFFGFGNEAPNEVASTGYRTRQNVFVVFPSLRYEIGKRFETYAGPALRYSDTRADPNAIVTKTAPLGSGTFGQIAFRGGFRFDSRLNSTATRPPSIANGISDEKEGDPVTGVKAEVSASASPGAWDVASGYGFVDGEIAAYLGNPRAHVAVRAGGRKLWGDYPWFDAANIGGHNNRGFSSHRFSGDSSVYGTLSLRGWLGTIPTGLVPIRLGVIAFGDAGRVWYAGETSDVWHTSVGGGLMLQPAGLPITIHGMAGHSKEGTRYLFGFGYPF